jgi:hypothetical protein
VGRRWACRTIRFLVIPCDKLKIIVVKLVYCLLEGTAIFIHLVLEIGERSGFWPWAEVCIAIVTDFWRSFENGPPLNWFSLVVDAKLWFYDEEYEYCCNNSEH